MVKVNAPTVDAPNPRTVTVDDGGVLLDATTMTATADVPTDVLVWQTAAGVKLTEAASFTSSETTEGEYSYFVKEYRMVNGSACYSDSVLATLVLSNCTAKSPTVENQKLCVGDDGNVTLTAAFAGASSDKKLSWFSDKECTQLLQDGSETYSTTISTASEGTTTFYVAEYDEVKACWSVPTSVTVTVNPLPTVEIAEIGYVCYSSTNQTASGIINGVASTAGTWSVVDDKISIGAKTGVIDPTSAGKTDGVYTAEYTYTDNNGCTNSAQKEFNVEYPEKPSSAGYLGIVSKPDEVLVSVDNASLEPAYSAVKWYKSATASSAESTGLSWQTGDDPATKHTATYYVSQVVNGCESEKADVLVQIVDCPFAKPEIETVYACQDDATVPDLQASLPQSTTVSADSWVWYDANKTLLNGGSNSFAPQVSTATAGMTKFYVGYLATEPTTGEQCPSPLAEVSVVVNPLPTVSFLSSKDLVCYDEGDVVWKPSNAGGVWTVDGEKNNGMSQAGVFNPAFFGETTSSHTVAYTYTDAATSCVATVDKNITVQYSPVPTTTGHSALVEENKVVTISASTSESSATVSWYNELGAVVSHEADFATGDSPQSVVNKKYYATQTINGCESQKAEASVVIISCPVPKPVVVQPSAICNYDNAPELTATLGDWPSGTRPSGVQPEVFNFYDVETGGTPVSSSPSGKFTPTIDATMGATYTYWVSEYNGNVLPAACEGKRSKISFSVKKTAAPTISVAEQSVCKNAENPEFVAVGQGTIQWYETEPTSPADAVDAVGVSFKPSAVEAGAHSVWATATVDGCVSESAEASFTIKAIPEAPSVTDARICLGDEKTSVCATSNGTVSWYSAPNASGKLASGTCYSPNATAAGIYTYYATQTVDGCESAATPATYTIVASPALPIVVTERVSCEYDDSHLLSVVEQEGVTVAWYSSVGLDSQIATGNEYRHTISGTGQQTYYVRQIANGCVGNYVTANFNIIARPETPKVVNDVVCVGEMATLGTDGPRDLWYSDEALTQLEGQGYSYSISEVAADAVMYVVRERNGCRSEVAEAKATVIPQPSVAITTDNEEVTELKRCVYEEEKLLVAEVSPAMSENDYVQWTIFPGNVVVKDEALLLSDHVAVTSGNTSNLNYTIRAQYLVKNEAKNTYCASAMDTVRVSTSGKPRKPIVLSTVVCQGETIEPMYAFGSKNITWMSMDGIMPAVARGHRYEFAPNQELTVGEYSFRVFDEDENTGCYSDTVDVSMTLAPAAETKIFGADSVCVDATETYFTHFNETSTYRWSVTGNNVNYSKDALSSAAQYVDWNKPGIDTLVVFEQTWAGCQGADTMIVKIADKPRARFVWSLPGASNVIELVDSTVQDSVKVQLPTGEWYTEEVSYVMRWNYGHQGSTSDIDLEVPYEKRKYPVVEGGYVYGYNCPVLTVENAYGCTDVYSECVFVDITSGLYVPSAFSPTNPAHSVRNFHPVGYNIKTCKVSVYDKWGNLVWYSDEVEDGMFVGKWDGTCNGKMMKSDVYIWRMEVTFLDGKVWEGFDAGNGKKAKYGNVMLIR